MKNKFLLFGIPVGSNYGCDAIVLGTERIIHHHFPNSEVWMPHTSWRQQDYSSVLGYKKEVIVKNASLEVRLESLIGSISNKLSLPTNSLVVPKKLVRQADCVLSIGGDLYTFANQEKNWSFPYSIIKAGNKIIRTGTPYVIWCASVGPLEKAGNRLGEMIDHFQACRAIVVREHDSYKYLRDNLGLKDNVYLAADPAFLMEPEAFVDSFLTKDSTLKILAVNFSLAPMQHVYGHKPSKDFQNKLIQWIEHLLDKLPIKILFIPHVKSDYDFLTPIFQVVNKLHYRNVHMLPANVGAQKTKWAISQANVLLTMRFHCALAGFATNTPTMILVSTIKGAKICKEIYGNLEYGLNIDDVNADILHFKIKDLLDNESTFRQQIKKSSDEMKLRALDAGRILDNVL